MAEKKTVSAASSGRKKTSSAAAKTPVSAGSAGSATGKRVGAIVLWLLAIACEVVAVLALFVKIEINFMNTLAFVIIMLVVDMILVIVGSSLWKKANHIDPASEKNKVKFWLWNNMGLIVTAFAFIPFVVLALTNKEVDKKTKTVASIVAVVAAVIAGLCSIEWNPLSVEEKAAQEGMYADATLPEGDVFFSHFGKKYHLYEDCQHINDSNKVYSAKATREEEESEAGKSLVEIALDHGCDDVCKTCKKKFEEANGITSEDKSADTKTEDTQE